MPLSDAAFARKVEDAVTALEDAHSRRDFVAMVQGIKVVLPLLRNIVREGSAFLHWFIAIDSDCDRFPTGPERRNWNKDALARLDRELAESHASLPDDLAPQLRRLRTVILPAVR
ncbi:MAG: hypothetical protein EP335_17875 [Alphaproteobacteria bacterium]|nr:MAG: hypothetical protein EP335_17875 [Alphaproteobacteria bacterium]